MNAYIDRITAAWSLRNVSILDIVSTYPTRYVVLLDSHRGRLAVKVEVGSSTGLKRAADLLSWLEGRRFPHAPTMLPTTDGRAVATWDSHSACALEFIPDRVASGRELEPSLWSALGGAVARLHSLGRSSLPHGVPVDLALKEIAQWAQDFSFHPDVLEILEDIGPVLGDGSATVVHGEVNHANVAYRSDGTVVLLDWDQAGDTQTFMDLGYPLITQFIMAGTHVFHSQAARAFYHAACGLTRPHPERVFAAALLHALRYARFAETELRWRRIRWALDHKEELCSVVG